MGGDGGAGGRSGDGGREEGDTMVGRQTPLIGFLVSHS